MRFTFAAVMMRLGRAVMTTTSSHAARAIERAGWNLIAGQVFDGVLTFAAAQAMFTRLQHLLDVADWTDLPAVFTRQGLEEARHPLPVRVQQYLDAHAGRKVSLHEVSRAVGASVRQTTREFHRRRGLSVRAYLARQRVAYAARLLVETDSPYLPPVPYRGKRNEPAYVVHTARRLAEVRNQDPAAVAAATTANFRRIFLTQSDPAPIRYTEGFE